MALAASAATNAEVTATQDAIITFDSKISPRVLPRSSSVPVAVRIEGHVRARKRREPAPLTRLQFAITQAATVFKRGLPACDIASIDPSSSTGALEACAPSQVGHGRIRAESHVPGQRRFFFDGRVLLFNGRLESGRAAILVHAFNSRPPSSFVFPFTISSHRGLYGTVLAANVHIGRWSRITDFELVLDRTFRYAGVRRGFLNASCPAPKGFTAGVSAIAQATLGFGDGSESEISVLSSCKVAT